ncbi:MAG: hypothetical protein R3F56_09180 [Planctomycetota bacterium]
MKQPAKVSLAGAVLAVLAAIFYPKLSQQADSATSPPPAVSQTEAGRGSVPSAAEATAPAAQRQNPAPRQTPATRPEAPPSSTAGSGAAGLAPKEAASGSGGARAPPSPPVSPKAGSPSSGSPKSDGSAAGGAAVPTAPATTKDAASKPAAPEAAKPAPAKSTSKVGFTSRRSWLDHFEKHGAEFGKITADEYLAKAQALRDAKLIPTILEGVRPSDGVITRFDKKTGAFIAFHDDKSIRTFFRPNDGVAYFKRQLER